MTREPEYEHDGCLWWSEFRHGVWHYFFCPLAADIGTPVSREKFEEVVIAVGREQGYPVNESLRRLRDAMADVAARRGIVPPDDEAWEAVNDRKYDEWKDRRMGGS